MQELMLAVTQLFVAFLLQLRQADLEELLLAEAMGDLQDEEHVINLSSSGDIFSDQSQQCFYF